jgi:hypothetical protein
LYSKRWTGATASLSLVRAGGSGRTIGWAPACLLALALCAALASCGGDSSEATAKAGTEAVTTGSPTTDAARVKAEHAVHTNTQDSTLRGGPCVAQLAALLVEMDGLRGELVAGLAYEGYVGQVQKVVASYDEVAVDALTLGCLRTTGTPAERALNRYIAAGNEWTDCVEVPSCEAASIETALQAKWKEASEYLSKARHGLRQQSSG